MVPGPDPALGWSRAWLLWFYNQLCHQQQTGQWGPSVHGQDIPKITPVAADSPGRAVSLPCVLRGTDGWLRPRVTAGIVFTP